ncbi:inositol monophosphatase [Enterobacteriaceae bacterium EKM102V]|uniref:Inositol monophosphatase n=1 Tax=Pantoea anthophila TaxID=470931 RepID=A0ABY2Z314_9GAMM|nr:MULTISPECIES: inositol monophosphatase family protein [Pantoea]KAF6662991.1 inositol monophosphatase [Enterobacteriaceae bacterium EKM102V]EIB98790.1 inositol monophosphatase [Pantoea sp. Sc1]KAF6669051.1 inositol monophosphatase [Pantoea sp. EKM101V]KAF6671458.1 inositol monophosphatase [Pantoea sp. EKM103V]MEB5704576.1 inositol monophosphatase family protein [Pantoea anthophila]
MASHDEIMARLAVAEAVAREGGATALSYFNRRETLVVETKYDLQDVVSIADRDVEQQIAAHLRAAFPDDGFLGEESGLQPGASDYTWVVDPIDGTSPFLNGMPNWCVSVAVLRGDLPVIGVIFAPLYDECYVAALGQGATLNGRRLAVDPARTLQNHVTGFGANSHVTPQQVGEIVAALLTAGGNFIRLGSGALMLAWVAAGRVVGYYEPYMHAWDCLAGYCLVKEAGGWYHPFNTEGDRLTRGAQVLAVAPGAEADLRRIAGL